MLGIEAGASLDLAYFAKLFQYRYHSVSQKPKVPPSRSWSWNAWGSDFGMILEDREVHRLESHVQRSPGTDDLKF